MRISARTQLCIIIGDPVEHSLSPVMHNAGYEALGIDDQFVFVAARVNVEDVAQVVKGVRVMGIRGLTCTMPHKLEVMKYLDEIDPVARKIGAVNTVVNDQGVMKGYNTDWLGTVEPLEKMAALAGKRVALIGAGGAARAMAYGIISKGAKLKIYNRTIDTAQELANEFQCEAAGLDALPEVTAADIIVNSTSLGMGDLVGETPVPKESISSRHIVFDAVYDPLETRLLREAREKGARVIHGTEMLLHQGFAQFTLYTGRKAPEEAMRKALRENLVR